MDLTNEFRMAMPVDAAWTVLSDVARIAPCMPGARITAADGDGVTGELEVRVGPITAQYEGTAAVVEKDDAAHKAVLRVEGRDTSGEGQASALVTATLVPDGDGTRITLGTDLTVTGKLAQFGQEMLADVSVDLVDRFVQCLESGAVSSSDVVAHAELVSPPDGVSPTDVVAAGARTAERAAATSSHGVAAGGGPARVTADPAGTADDPVAPGSGPTAAPVTPTGPAGPRTIGADASASAGHLGTARGPAGSKRFAPVFVLVVIIWLLKRRKHESTGRRTRWRRRRG